MTLDPRHLLFLVAAVPAAASLSVHEWGTFTTVNGSDGRQLPGLEVEEENLPPFVHSLTGFAPLNKGWNRPVRGVTVKMETPVVYFYSDQHCRVRLEVGFNGGSISQWYPERTAGETMPPPPAAPARADPVDFAAGYRGSATWQVDVLAPGARNPISAPREWETPQWPRARVAAANRVRGPKGVVEGFIFYRGLGHFEPPLRVSSDGTGRIRLENTGPDRIPFVFILECRAAAHGIPDGMVWWQGALDPGESHVESSRWSSISTSTIGAGVETGAHLPEKQSQQGNRGMPLSDFREKAFPAALVAAGLTPAEAKAMLDTWHESYFERPGLRVFWIVPRNFTDRVLPMSITPLPEKVERVLVGRSEVLTPAFEAELARDFATDGGRRWAGDRFFRAYAERARQLGVALPPVKP